MANSSFIPPTKEYKVLQKHFGTLLHTIIDPVTLAAELYSADLISESTRMKATTENNNRTTRNYYLLDELMVVVAKDCTNLMKIISVLQCYPPLLSAIAEDMKTECESSVTATIQSVDQQHPKSIVTVGESAYNDLTIMQMKLGGLVLTIKKEVKSAGIEFDDIKDLLILSYPFEKEFQEAENFSHIFVAVRKHCSPVNIEVLVRIISHFKLTSALTAIQEYEIEKESYRKKLLSATFAQELMKEAELIGRNPTSDCTIALKLKWARDEPSTVKEFEIEIKNLFLDYSQYIHLYKVDEGCVFVTMCAPKPLMGALVKMTKTRIPYLLDIGVILLQIGDEVILDKREKEEVRVLKKEIEELRQQVEIQQTIIGQQTMEVESSVQQRKETGSNITDTPGSIGLPQNVSGDENIDNSTEREVIHTEVYQDQPLPVDNSSIISTISQTAPQQQSQLSNVSKLKKEVISDGTDDSGNDTATGLYTPTWRKLPSGTYDVLIIGSCGEISDSQNIQVAHKLIPSDQEGSNQWMTKEIDLIRELNERDRQSYLVLVCSDLPGTKQSKDYYLEKIRNFLTNCKQERAIIRYTGHGEKNTGNWCFKDGVITFQDIFGLYMDCFRGKLLNIHSDCSYSGNWIKDCVNTLDDLGIPSCGHRTREQGILFKMFCSCGANEEATALCYITEANIFDETNKYVMICSHKKLSSGQTTKLGEFTDIRCSKTATETCEIDSTCTWEDRIFTELYQIYLVRGKDKGKQAWHYVLVDEDKIEDFNAKVKTGRIDVADYGTVLHYGWGQDPPKDIIRKVELRFKSYLDPDY